MYFLVKNRAPTSKDTAELLWQLRGQISVMPRVVITDGGSEFKGEFSKTFAKFGALHLTTSPRASWMNGRVERIHKTLQPRINEF
jgi:transposase InsO family protein